MLRHVLIKADLNRSLMIAACWLTGVQIESKTELTLEDVPIAPSRFLPSAIGPRLIVILKEVMKCNGYQPDQTATVPVKKL